MAYIHLDPSLPRKPHYPPCILPGSFCWSVNTTSSTPCCLRELSPWEESGEEESRGRRRRSLSFFLALFWRESLMLALYSQASALNQIPLTISCLGAQQETVPVTELSRLSEVQRLHHFIDIWRNSHSADALLSFICWAWHSQTLITWCCFVTLMLTRESAAVLNWSIIPVLPLPPGTAYELMRRQQRCHVFIHSISPKEKITSMEELI